MMKNLKYLFHYLLFTWLFIFLQLNMSGQLNSFSKASKIDSLKQFIKTDKNDSTKISHLLLLSNYLSVQNPDSAILLSKEALMISEKLNWALGIGQSYFQLSLNHKFKIDYTNSLNESYKALAIFEQLEKNSSTNKSGELKDWQLKVLTNIGLVYTLKGEYQNSLDYELKASTLAEKNENTFAKINLTNQIGINYKELGNYLKALDYFLVVLKQADEMGEIKLAMQSMIYIAGVFVLREDYPKALYYYSKALKIAEVNWKEQVLVIKLNITNVYAKQRENNKALEICFKVLKDEKQLNKYYKCTLYNLISDIYENQNQYALALDYDNKAFALAEEIGDKKGMATSLSSIGKLLLITKNYQDAEATLVRALAISDSIHLLKLKLETEKSLSELYKQTGSEHKELEYLKRATISKDSLYNVAKEKDMTRKEMNYEFEKKQALSKAEIERKDLIAKQQLQTQKIIRNSFIAGSILLLILIFVLINRAKLKRKIELEQMRNRLSRDLHDDIGSTLSSINILSRKAQRNAQLSGDENAKASLEKINERSQRLLTSMSDIIWNINPNNDSIEELFSRMREYATTLLEAKDIDCTIDFRLEKVDTKLAMDVKSNLYLIFKEAVNNLSKYSACTKAILKFDINEKFIRLVVEDNGRGFDVNEIKHRGGLLNMQYRAEEIKGKLSITSEIGKGTRIEFVLSI